MIADCHDYMHFLCMCIILCCVDYMPRQPVVDPTKPLLFWLVRRVEVRSFPFPATPPSFPLISSSSSCPSTPSLILISTPGHPRQSPHPHGMRPRLQLRALPAPHVARPGRLDPRLYRACPRARWWCIRAISGEAGAAGAAIEGAVPVVRRVELCVEFFAA